MYKNNSKWSRCLKYFKLLSFKKNSMRRFKLIRALRAHVAHKLTARLAQRRSLFHPARLRELRELAHAAQSRRIARNSKTWAAQLRNLRVRAPAQDARARIVEHY